MLNTLQRIKENLPSDYLTLVDLQFEIVTKGKKKILPHFVNENNCIVPAGQK